MLRIERYGTSRFWALYDGQDLVVVTVYKRGAQEVRRRLAAQPPAATAAAAQAAAVDAAARQAQELAEHARALARQAQAAAQAVQAHAQSSGYQPAGPRHPRRYRARLAAAATSGNATRRPAAPP
jgi:hypothetical protein